MQGRRTREDQEQQRQVNAPLGREVDVNRVPRGAGTQGGGAVQKAERGRAATLRREAARSWLRAMSWARTCGAMIFKDTTTMQPYARGVNGASCSAA